MRKPTLSLAAAFFFSLSSFSQSITPSILNATGGSYHTADGNFYVDWNAGEMVLVNTVQGGNVNNLLIITNGLLQPEKEPSVISAKANLLTNSDIKLYPNPAVDYVAVVIQQTSDAKVQLILYDVMGQQVYSKQFGVNAKNRVELIPMSRYRQGTYLLQVITTSGGTTRQGSFKIVKTN